MPMGLLPVTPEKTGKPPKTPEEFHEVLTHWLRNQPELQQDGQRQAYEDYVSKTTLLAKDYGLSVALAYHAEVVKALLRQPFSLYDPYLHGPTYQAAYLSLVHGKPKLGARTFTRYGRGKAASGASESSAGGKKRKPSAASTAAEADCSVPGHVGHTNADCRWQKLKKQKTSKKAKRSVSTASSSAAASGAASDSD
jgi:hypothetical protein